MAGSWRGRSCDWRRQRGPLQAARGQARPPSLGVAKVFVLGRTGTWAGRVRGQTAVCGKRKLGQKRHGAHPADPARKAFVVSVLLHYCFPYLLRRLCARVRPSQTPTPFLAIYLRWRFGSWS